MSAVVAPREAEVLESLRQSLPLEDPDRHTLDTVADDLFARLAPGYPSGGAE